MKKHLFILPLLLFGGTALAQPWWERTALTPGANGNILGINDNFPLQIFTNNAQRIIVGANGNIGLGDFLTPLNQQHNHVITANTPNLLQFTNNNTGVAANRGLLFGLNAASDGLLNYQENGRFTFFTGGVGLNRSRLVLDRGLGFGITSTNITRISIDYGEYPGTYQPISTAPVSLLNLGATQGMQDGRRNWMDVGIYMAAGTDNMYVGLMDMNTTPGIGGDRFDAVINWGDNATANNNGPDNLRFIFTASPAGNDTGNVQNGLEVARFVPQCLSAECVLRNASLGVGNFAPGSGQGPGTAGYIGATLDVDGDARIRSVQQDNTLTQVLMRNPADRGRLFWRDVNTIGGGGISADNGCTIAGTATVQLGYGIGPPAGFFTVDRTIPMSGFNLLFDGTGSPGGNITSFGNTSPWIGTPSSTKLYLFNDSENSGGAFYTDASSLTQQNTLNGVTGVEGHVANFTLATASATGVFGHADGTVAPMLAAPRFIHGTYGYAVGDAQNSLLPVGARGYARSTSVNTSVMGGLFEASSDSAICYGVYASVLPGNTNANSYSGFFQGAPIWVIGSIYPSDATLKKEVKPIENAMSLLQKINVYSYRFNSSALPQANFDEGLHFGVLSQELEQVIPSMVQEGTYRETEDPISGKIYPAKTVKGVNYVEFVPVLIQGVKELEHKLSEQAALIDSLNNRLQKTEDDIQRLYALLSSTPPTNPGNESGPIPITEVTLAGEYFVVLEQNVPNPFAENTAIRFHIPEEVREARIIFSDASGKVIQTITLSDRGWGKVQVYAGNLGTGLYTYTLVLDGKVQESRKMLKN